MCGRYYRKSDKQKIAEAFRLGKLIELPLEVAPSFNVAPTTMQPVIVNDRDTGERAMKAMRWGLVPAWAKDLKAMGLSTINAKAESLMDKPMWKSPFKKRRCLVVADGFYEWKKLDPKTKQPYAFQLSNGMPLAFAGVWEHWKAPDGSMTFDTYSIITTDPNELTSSVHNRMPVILKPSDYDRWLDTSNQEQPPIDLLRPFDASEMTAHLVDPKVGNVRNNEPGLCVEYECPPNSA